MKYLIFFLFTINLFAQEVIFINTKPNLLAVDKTIDAVGVGVTKAESTAVYINARKTVVDSIKTSPNVTLTESTPFNVFYGDTVWVNYTVDVSLEGNYNEFLTIYNKSRSDTVHADITYSVYGTDSTLTAPYSLVASSSITGIEITWSDSNKSANLIVNGYNFNSASDTSYWATDYERVIESDRMKVIDNSDSTYPSTYRYVTGLTIGEDYYYRSDGFVGTNGNSSVYISYNNDANYYLNSKLTTNDVHNSTFTALDDSAKIYLQMEGLSDTGLYCYHDNVDLRRVDIEYDGFEIWAREYPDTIAWSMLARVWNKDNIYSHAVNEGDKYGYRVRYFTYDNSYFYTDFTNEDTLTYGETPSYSDFNGTYLADVDITWDLVPTYENIGVYAKLTDSSDFAGSSSITAQVFYKKATESTWQRGHDLWFDSMIERDAIIANKQPYLPIERQNEYRGSIVRLVSETAYDVEVRFDSDADGDIDENDHAYQGQITTWTEPENLPLASTVLVPNRSSQLNITTSGTANGYIKYTPDPSATTGIDVNNSDDYCININASYIIIDGLTLKGAKIDGIHIEENQTDIIIMNCDISEWGRILADGWGQDMDAGIRCYGYTGNTGVYDGSAAVSGRRFTFQDNKIHHPRSDANSKSELRTAPEFCGDPDHVAGPMGIALQWTEGHHVIRNNEIYSDWDHYFAYCIMGWENVSYYGAFVEDCDIYGNEISHTWGHGIEVEGGNQNVRVYDNQIDEFLVAFGNAVNSIGPLYLFNNITFNSRYLAYNDRNDAGRGYFIKTGGLLRDNDTPPGGTPDGIYESFVGGGRAYIYHNTMVQRSGGAGRNTDLGAGGFMQGTGGDIFNYHVLNNIFVGTDPNITDSSKYAEKELQQLTCNDPIRETSINFHQYTHVIDGNSAGFTTDLVGGYVATNTNYMDYNARALGSNYFMYKIGDVAGSSSHDPNGWAVDNYDIHYADSANGDYSLANTSTGYDEGIRIFGFNDNYGGQAPDIGAFEDLSAVTWGTAPSSLTATLTNTDSISLSWQDNTSDEDGFKIERNSVQIATVGASSESYIDADLPNGTYTYRIRAFKGSLHTDYSNTDSETVSASGATAEVDSLYILASSDDTYKKYNSLYNTSTTLYAGHSSTEYEAGMRFYGMDDWTTIDSAKFFFTAKTAKTGISGDTVRVRYIFEDTQSPATYSDGSNWDTRYTNGTTAFTDSAYTLDWTADTEYNVDVTSAIQELNASYTYSGTDYINLFVLDNGTTQANKLRDWYSQDNGSKSAYIKIWGVK